MLLPEVARVGAAYVLGDDGSNVCPANLAKIWDEPTCVAAAASVGVTSVTTEATYDSPAGCYYSYSLFPGKSVYLNEVDYGAGNSGSTPLCKGAHPRPAACAASLSRGPGG